MVSFDLCEGNPVALTFMMQAYSVAMFKAETAFQRMQDNGISGSKLYMLWNDCCNRDTAKAVEIMINRGNLHSGRELHAVLELDAAGR